MTIMHEFLLSGLHVLIEYYFVIDVLLDWSGELVSSSASSVNASIRSASAICERSSQKYMTI